MAKRGLIVTYYFPPAGGGGIQRWVKFVKYLSRLDWDLTIITAAVENAHIDDPEFLNEIPPKTKIIRPEKTLNISPFKDFFIKKLSHSYWQRWISSFFNITDSRAAWNNTAKKLIDRELGSATYDALIISLPPYSLAELAAFYTEKLKIPVFLDMRDPWTKNPYKIYASALHRKIDETRERLTISRTENLICAYQSIAHHYKRSIKSLSDKSVIVIPNGYDEEDFSALPEKNLMREEVFHIAFSGSFYSHLNRPDQFLKAIRVLREQGKQVQFHHIGESVYDLGALAARFKVGNNVKLWGYRSHRECLEILAGMNAFCFFLDPGILNADKTVGGKVYEYLRFKKPILAVVPEKGEAANLITATNSGLVCPVNSAHEISKALLRIISDPEQFTYDNISAYNRKHQAELLNNFILGRLN